MTLLLIHLWNISTIAVLLLLAGLLWQHYGDRAYARRTGDANACHSAEAFVLYGRVAVMAFGLLLLTGLSSWQRYDPALAGVPPTTNRMVLTVALALVLAVSGTAIVGVRRHLNAIRATPPSPVEDANEIAPVDAAPALGLADGETDAPA